VAIEGGRQTPLKLVERAADVLEPPLGLGLGLGADSACGLLGLGSNPLRLGLGLLDDLLGAALRLVEGGPNVLGRLPDQLFGIHPSEVTSSVPPPRVDACPLIAGVQDPHPDL
jgi:hypothetical protein